MRFFSGEKLHQGWDTGERQNEIPLSVLGEGDFGTVSRLDGDESFRGKMIALGIHPGKITSVVRGCRFRPYIIRVEDSRLMLDWESLQKIFVQMNPDPEITGRRRRRRCRRRWNG